MENEAFFNQRLKFSWGHIIASIALIAIAYGTFVGTVYLLHGQFLLSGIITAAITLLVGGLFLASQQLKATDHNFQRRIRWERALVFSSPILFIVLMVPFAHSWTVHHRQQQIVDSFHSILASADELFDKYEVYSHIRELNYRYTLGVTEEGASISDSNKLEVLHLSLRSSNYDALKSASQMWMDKSVNKEVSTWNVFLLGNITEIRKAIHNWYDDMKTFSAITLSDEDDVRCFDSSSHYINDIDNQIDALAALYSDIKGFSPLTLLWVLLGYAMLLLPYLLQDRYSKTIGTTWTLFGFLNRQKGKETEEVPVGLPADDAEASSKGNESYESFKL